MISWPPPRRVLVYAALGIIAIATTAGALPGVLQVPFRMFSEVERKRQLLAGIENTVSRRRALEDSSAVILEGFRQQSSRLLPVATAAEAGTYLAARIDAVRAETAVQLSETTLVEDTTRVALLRRVSIKAVLTGDLDGLMAIMQQLAGDTVAISIDAIRLKTNGVISTDAGPEALIAEILLRAWYLVPDTTHRRGAD